MRVEKIKEKLLEKHGDLITIDEETYCSVHKSARFIHKDHGEFWAIPSHIIYRGDGHPNDRIKKRKTTCLAKYGVEVPVQSPAIKAKIEATCLARYGSTSPLSNSIIHQKTKDTLMENYGVSNATQSPKIMEKIYETNLERYGFKTPLQSDEIKEKAVKTNLKKYGFKNPQQNSKIRAKTEATNMGRYGTKAPAQSLEIGRKCARNQTKSVIKKHWLTEEDIICTASYECVVVDWLNNNKIKYKWQHQVFKMPNEKTYRPDLYLIDEDKWIEIKGYFRKDAKEKWDWFHKEYLNSELWDKNILIKMKLI